MDRGFYYEGLLPYTDDAKSKSWRSTTTCLHVMISWYRRGEAVDHIIDWATAHPNDLLVSFVCACVVMKTLS